MSCLFTLPYELFVYIFCLYLFTALGRINHNAIMDLMSELVNYIREAIDRKQENMRRRRRRYECKFSNRGYYFYFDNNRGYYSEFE